MLRALLEGSFRIHGIGRRWRGSLAWRRDLLDSNSQVRRDSVHNLGFKVTTGTRLIWRKFLRAISCVMRSRCAFFLRLPTKLLSHKAGDIGHGLQTWRGLRSSGNAGFSPAQSPSRSCASANDCVAFRSGFNEFAAQSVVCFHCRRSPPCAQLPVGESV
jgi:hypothetical protein